MHINRLLNVMMIDYRVYAVLCLLLFCLAISINPALAPRGFEQKIKSGATLITREFYHNVYEHCGSLQQHLNNKEHRLHRSCTNSEYALKPRDSSHENWNAMHTNNKAPGAETMNKWHTHMETESHQQVTLMIMNQCMCIPMTCDRDCS